MPSRHLAASLTSLALVLGSQSALADQSDAQCVLRKDGETKQGASGACSFSQRQGYIDIDLRNGTTYSLKPGDQANHYRDQEGKKVVRTVNGDGSHEYKWEGKKIIVTFPEENRRGANHGGGHSGDTPHGLRDLPGSRYVGGEVDDEMVRRGYKHVKNEQSGGEIWSTWRGKSGGECVVVHMTQNRHVASIVNAPSSDCNR